MSCLHVRELSVGFLTPTGMLRAVDGVSLDHSAGETLALIGESGCGKSVAAAAVAGLLPRGARVSGRIDFLGRNLLELSGREMAALRGSSVSLVLQNPQAALNPVQRIGAQIGEPLCIHRGMRRGQAMPLVRSRLERLGFRDVEDHLSALPHQFSGGMCQRVLIAAAMILDPRLLIADEPTKGLDAPLQAAVREELRSIKTNGGSSLLLITHDVGLARDVSERIAVMYGGWIVETGPTQDVLTEPLHPYTRALLRSLPENGFQPIGGPPLDMTAPPSGCRFQPRCDSAFAECAERAPDTAARGQRSVRCLKYS